MPTKRFALEPSGPIRLEVQWGATIFTPCTVRLDGYVITTFPFKELRQGKTIRLPDGSSLYLKPGSFGGLHILRDEAPLPGAAPDRPQMVVGYIVFLSAIGGIGGLVGLGVGLALLLGNIPADNGPIIGPVVMLLSLLSATGLFFIIRGLWRLQNWARLSMIWLLSLLLLSSAVFAFSAFTSNFDDFAPRCGQFVFLLIALGYGIFWFNEHADEFTPAEPRKEGRRPLPQAAGALVDPTQSMELLSHPDKQVRLSAIIALAKSSNPRAVPALVAMLEDQDHEIRQNAAAVLSIFLARPDDFPGKVQAQEAYRQYRQQ